MQRVKLKKLVRRKQAHGGDVHLIGPSSRDEQHGCSHVLVLTLHNLQ